MKKLCVVLYSICLLSISLYGLSSQSYYVQLLINLGKPYMLVRTALVMVLIAYTFLPWLRIYTTKALLGLVGILLLSLGLTSIISPDLFGHLNSWMVLGDVVTLIEGGILAIVLSTELSARRTNLMARSFINIQSFVATRPSKLVYSPPIQPVKILKMLP